MFSKNNIFGRHEYMDRLMDIQPEINRKEEENQHTILVKIQAGFDHNIQLKNELLTIKTQKKTADSIMTSSTSFSLPNTHHSNIFYTEIKNGVLEITVPKLKEEQKVYLKTPGLR